MTLLAYLLVASAVTFACHRWLARVAAGAAIVLIALPLLVTGATLVTDQVYGGFDLLFLVQPFSDYAEEHRFRGAHNRLLVDHVMQMAPWQRQVREAWSRGEWPLWNPAMNSGDILAATMQPAPYSPLNLLALLLPLDLATTFAAATILFLAALFTYLFARELACSEGASLIAASGYALSGAVLFWAGWSHLGGSWALLPLVLLATRRGTFALLTIALTLLVLFGHPESMLHVVAIGVAYGLFQRPDLRRIATALGAGVVALLVTAIFLLPFVDALDDSLEYLERKSWSRQFPFNAENVRATFVLRSTLETSGQWGEWNEQGARVGSVILALATIAAFRSWRMREVRFFAILAMVALLASWHAPPVAQLLRLLPLFDIALNERLAFAAAFALSLLAAFAFDARGGRAIVIVVAVFLAVLTASAWYAHWATDVNPRMLVAGAVAELAGIALLVVALSVRSPRVALALVLAAIAAQRFVADGKMYPTLPRAAFYPTTPLIDAIPRDPLYRAIGHDAVLIPNVASMYGRDDIRAYTTMNNLRYMETRPLWSGLTRHYHNVLDLSRPFLSFLGVRHAVVPRETEPADGWRIAAEDRSCRLLENTRALPRVFVPRNLRWIDTSS
ncbi:MAG TPA: YfhO family protein, partial [Thermoanaerobaculia bacterium]|nr:YfhO family protein [Thermoanaerobaculia bacterium]